MEEIQKGSKTSKLTSSSASSSIIAAAAPPAPWLDLPYALTDLILERLPLSDYLRFAAVCRQWRSIQRAHRLLHAPAPPPMPHPMPWILPLISYGEGPISCFSIADCAIHRLPLPSASHGDFPFASTHGWIFVHKHTWEGNSVKTVYLLNPISGGRIELPPLSAYQHPAVGFLSSRPTDPNSFALLIDRLSDEILLCRVSGNREWVKFHPSELRSACPFYTGTNAVFSRGRFYCLYGGLFVVDPLSAAPSIRKLKMDLSKLPKALLQSHYLVECQGEVLLVVAIRQPEKYAAIKEFRLFKADLSRKMWVSARAIRDFLIFIGANYSFSILASDVGCSGRRIINYTDRDYGYESSDSPRKTYDVFDMDSREWRNGSPFPHELARADCYYWGRWFIPSLECLHPL